MKLIMLLGPIQALKFIWQWIVNKKLIDLKVRNIPTKLWVRCSPYESDIKILWQTFVTRDCDIPFQQPRLIIDAGAYIGSTSVYFANKYPEAKIVSIEPNKDNCELFRMNCSQYPNIHLIQKGLWNSNTNLKIVNPYDPSWAFRLSEVPSETNNAIEGITIPELLRQFKATWIDLLKIDIEGAEQTLFSSSCTEWLDKVKTIIIEIHGRDCKETIMRAISHFNFEVSYQGEKAIFTRKDVLLNK